MPVREGPERLPRPLGERQTSRRTERSKLVESRQHDKDCVVDLGTPDDLLGCMVLPQTSRCETDLHGGCQHTDAEMVAMSEATTRVAFQFDMFCAHLDSNSTKPTERSGHAAFAAADYAQQSDATGTVQNLDLRENCAPSALPQATLIDEASLAADGSDVHSTLREPPAQATLHDCESDREAAGAVSPAATELDELDDAEFDEHVQQTLVESSQGLSV